MQVCNRPQYSTVQYDTVQYSKYLGISRCMRAYRYSTTHHSYSVSIQNGHLEPSMPIPPATSYRREEPGAGRISLDVKPV